MFHIAVRFDVPADRRDDFIAAALEDGRDSLAHEPGTLRYELMSDTEDDNKFYLHEAYESAQAFELHRAGAPCVRFFERISDYAVGPEWLMKARTIESLA